MPGKPIVCHDCGPSCGPRKQPLGNPFAALDNDDDDESPATKAKSAVKDKAAVPDKAAAKNNRDVVPAGKQNS